MKKILINKIDLKYLLSYPVTKESLFRINQDVFVSKCSFYAKKSIIEIGSEGKYGYESFFKNIEFRKTNPFREDFEKLDVTDIKYPNNSIDNILCVSVLEHVFDVGKAALEMTRTLKPGGHLFLAVPFAYPIHDTVDYWRLLPDTYKQLFSDFECLELFHLGGKFASCAEVLQRPRGVLKLRIIPARLAGWLCLLFSYFFERIDGFPTGYGLILKKK